MATKSSYCYTYMNEMQIGCTIQKITKAFIALFQSTGMRPFFKIFSPCLKVIQTWRVMEVLGTKEDGFGTNLQNNNLAEASSFLCGNEEVAAGVREKSAVVDQGLRCVAYQYVYYASTEVAMMRSIQS